MESSRFAVGAHLADQVGVAFDDGQRRAQFVADVCQEALLGIE